VNAVAVVEGTECVSGFGPFAVSGSSDVAASGQSQIVVRTLRPVVRSPVVRRLARENFVCIFVERWVRPLNWQRRPVDLVYNCLSGCLDR